MKIMEYNIMSGRNNEEIYARNYDCSLEVIRSENPDIVGICEVGRQPSDIFPAYDLDCEISEYFGRELNMDAYHGVAEYFSGYAYGVAILSKYPIKSAKTVKVPDVTDRKPGGYYESRCLAVCELDYPGGLTVIVSHFGLVHEERMNAVDTLLVTEKFIEDLSSPARKSFLKIMDNLQQNGYRYKRGSRSGRYKMELP